MKKTKINIFSGFLGAGKTTLIKKLISEAFSGEKIVIIENEFGEIGIDSGFLKESGVQISEMNSGCICCTLVGDFGDALNEVINKFSPDRIIIEPSGVGKLSDVIKAVKNIGNADFELCGSITVIDAMKCKIYLKNFSEFYENQIKHADAVIMSRTANISDIKLNEALEICRELNPEASIITTDWDKLVGTQILEAIEKKNSLSDTINELVEHIHCHHGHDDECDCDHHHEHHHHDDCECGCHHNHEHHHDECNDHHHDHHEECHGHHHEHHHDHDCECGCHHDHDHGHEHHHHHADEIFESWGMETTNKYTMEQIKSILDDFSDTEKYGIILRSKAIVAGEDQWIHFDFVPDEINVRYGAADTIGKICVIGSNLNKDSLAEVFNTVKK